MQLRRLVGLLGCLAPGLFGMWAVAHPRSITVDYSPVWSGLISGSIVAAVVFLAESSRDERMRRESHREALNMQILFQNDLTGVDFKGLDLRKYNLRGKVLRSANLERCVLSGMDLTRVDLRGANLRGAQLDECRLAEANLSLVDARGADFNGSFLGLAKLRGGLFGGARFRGADATGADCRYLSASAPEDLIEIGEVEFRSWHTGLRWTPSEGSYLTHLDGIDARKSVWRGAVLHGAVFREADLSYSTLGDGWVRAPVEGFSETLRILFSRGPERAYFTTRGGGGIRGAGIPSGPADFSGADMSGSNLLGSVGPELQFTDGQLESCAVAPSPNQLARRLVVQQGPDERDKPVESTDEPSTSLGESAKDSANNSSAPPSTYED